jgi:hypothetical protein
VAKQVGIVDREGLYVGFLAARNAGFPVQTLPQLKTAALF